MRNANTAIEKLSPACKNPTFHPLVTIGLELRPVCLKIPRTDRTAALLTWTAKNAKPLSNSSTQAHHLRSSNRQMRYGFTSSMHQIKYLPHLKDVISRILQESAKLFGPARIHHESKCCHSYPDGFVQETWDQILKPKKCLRFSELQGRWLDSCKYGPLLYI